jgi:hypothetical protein
LSFGTHGCEEHFLHFQDPYIIKRHRLRISSNVQTQNVEKFLIEHHEIQHLASLHFFDDFMHPIVKGNLQHAKLCVKTPFFL